VPVWLLVQAELRFNENLRPIFPRDYRPDLLAEASDVYYGVHFVSAPAKIDPGDQVVVELVFRAFPKDPCIAFQAGKRVSLKEGHLLVRAEGMITRRWEHESASKTLIELQQERRKLSINRISWRRRPQIGLRSHQQQCAFALERLQIVQAVKRFCFVVIARGRVIGNADRFHILESMFRQ